MMPAGVFVRVVRMTIEIILRIWCSMKDCPWNRNETHSVPLKTTGSRTWTRHEGEKSQPIQSGEVRGGGEAEARLHLDHEALRRPVFKGALDRVVVIVAEKIASENEKCMDGDDLERERTD